MTRRCNRVGMWLALAGYGSGGSEEDSPPLSQAGLEEKGDATRKMGEVFICLLVEQLLQQQLQ